MVFMQHGLAVAAFMASAALAAFWLWMRGVVKQVWHLPLVIPLLLLAATTVLCKSWLAVILMFVGMGALYLLLTPLGRVAVVLLIAIPPAYMLARTVGGWDARELLDLTRSVAGEVRMKSVQTRLVSEDFLTNHAMRRPVLGWGPRYLDIGVEQKVIPDGMWLIALGKYGLAGLAVFTMATLLPAVMFLRRVNAAGWRARELAPAVIAAMLLVLHGVDNLMNAMVNPLYMVMAGALVGLVAAPKRVVRRRAISPRPARPPRPAHATRPAGPGQPARPVVSVPRADAQGQVS
jgi:hypothetical protein